MPTSRSDAKTAAVAAKAEESGLGRLLGRGRHRTAASQAVTVQAVLGGIIGLIIPVTALGPERPTGEVVFFSAWNTMGLLCWAYLIARPILRRRGGSAWFLLSGGIAVTDYFGGASAFVAWEDMTGLSWHVVHRYVNYPPAGQTHRIRITRLGARRIELFESGERPALVFELRRLYIEAVFPTVLEALAEGETMPFGPFELSAAALTLGPASVPWPRVAACGVAGKNITVLVRGGSPLSAPFSRVRDPLIFQQVVAHLAYLAKPAPSATAVTAVKSATATKPAKSAKSAKPAKPVAPAAPAEPPKPEL